MRSDMSYCLVLLGGTQLYWSVSSLICDQVKFQGLILNGHTACSSDPQNHRLGTHRPFNAVVNVLASDMSLFRNLIITVLWLCDTWYTQLGQVYIVHFTEPRPPVLLLHV